MKEKWCDFFKVLLAIQGTLLFYAGFQASADEFKIEKHPDWSFRDAEMTPVMAGGRIKPLDSLARDAALFLTESSRLDGWDAVDLFYSIAAFPDQWKSRRIIKVPNKELKRSLLLEVDQSYFSPSELGSSSVFRQRLAERDEDKDLRRLADKLRLFYDIASGEAWRVLPTAPPSPWGTLKEQGDPGVANLRRSFERAFSAYREGNRQDFERAAAEARLSVENDVAFLGKGLVRSIFVEWLYQKCRPFFFAWICYFVAAAAFLAPRAHFARKLGLGGLSLGLALHLAGIVARCYVAGRPPVTNMYESVMWVSLGVVVFGMVAERLHGKAKALTAACVLGGLGLLSAQSSPVVLDASLQPLVPVLRDNFWLMVHVLTITTGYAAFALTLGLADYALACHLRGQSTQADVVNQAVYRVMQFGVVFLAAGTILGGVWADYAWGRFWGWDPKETWALIALLCYLIILHARFTGWVRSFGFSAWTIVAFLAVLMAWYGVNFVLGAGKHSYGFASGGLEWVLVFVAAHIAYVIVGALKISAISRSSKALD